ncbi:MAG: crossover junction endodeoxyribonuclease RuvC [Alphaproteobacteria bacterium]|nr:crossover junction endodeoxyribonuclease RuvC [Alphaproteobacteria bacterium]MBN2779846.1 crossover junction endodeoxyribonuclease RuvC [Alphaproteobacteria bacterium]
MIIMGIDPGLRHTGWGLIDKTGSTLKYIDQGTISPKATDTMSKRLAFIYQGLSPILEKYKPQLVGIEEVFSNKNPKTTLLLGQARGVALITPALFGAEVLEISATAIKKAIVGTGRADKNQIQMMTRILLGGQVQFDSEHSADALATAITTAHII